MSWTLMAVLAVALVGIVRPPQTAPIGSALREGLQLVYESGGVRQAPWVYGAVRVVERAGFERCVAVTRRGQAARETCLRDGCSSSRTRAACLSRSVRSGRGWN